MYNEELLEEMFNLLPKNSNLELAEVIAYKLTVWEIRNAFTFWKIVNLNTRHNKHSGKNKKTTAHRYGKVEGLYGVTKRITNILKLASDIKKVIEDDICEDDVLLTNKEELIIQALKRHAQEHARYCKEMKKGKG